MTYRETVNLGEKVLSMADIAEAKTDAWLLLEMVCKIDRSFYYLHMAEEMPEEQNDRVPDCAAASAQSMSRCSILWVRQNSWD